MLERVALGSIIVALYAIGVNACGSKMDPDMLEVVQMLRDNCGAESGVDVSLLDKINAGADIMPDPNLKCYMKCVMETAGMLENGEVDIETTLELLPQEIREKNEQHFRACGTKKGADDCETAYNTQVCWQNSNKKDYCMV